MEGALERQNFDVVEVEDLDLDFVLVFVIPG
jgi:hypothetical protein